MIMLSIFSIEIILNRILGLRQTPLNFCSFFVLFAEITLFYNSIQIKADEADLKQI